MSNVSIQNGEAALAPKNMSYFHIIAKPESAKEYSCIFSDLSNEELRSKFLQPYEKGQDILGGNTLIRIAELSAIQIIATQDKSEVELKAIQKRSHAEIDEINRQSDSIVFIGLGRGYAPEDIAEAGVDVTADYLKGPPGYASSIVPAFLNSSFLPWVATIISGLAVAGIAKWFGWV